MFFEKDTKSLHVVRLFVSFLFLEYCMKVWCAVILKMCNLDTDIGTEELAHLEMVSTIVHQLTCNLSLEEIQNSGFANYYVDHTAGIWPQAAGGVPFNSCEFQSKGDPLTDLFEDLAAEQKARSTYDNILRLVKDPEVADPIRFLRAREVVHFQRFGEALRSVQDELNSKNFYAFNPSFDAKTFCAATQPGAGQGNCCTR